MPDESPDPSAKPPLTGDKQPSITYDSDPRGISPFVEGNRMQARPEPLPLDRTRRFALNGTTTFISGPSDVLPHREASEQAAASHETSARASSWTGRTTLSEKAKAALTLGPLVMIDLQQLIDQVASRGFNDDPTLDALDRLKQLHAALGELVKAFEKNNPTSFILSAIGRHKAALTRNLEEGAKIAVVAPALTVGLTHLLSAACSVRIDTQLIGAVYGSLIAAYGTKVIGDGIAAKASE